MPEVLNGEDRIEMRSPGSFVCRAARILATGAFALTLIPSLPAAAEALDAPDYPAALIFPGDAAQAGFDDYGLVMGWYTTYDDMLLTMLNQGYEEDEAIENLDQTGIEVTYQASLHPISEPRDGQLHGIAIESTIYQFVDEEHAGDMLDDILTVYAEDDYDELDDMPELGDGSFSIAYDLEPNVSSIQEEHLVETAIRVGDVVGVVTLRGLGEGIEIDLDQAEQIAVVMEDKLFGLIDGDLVGSAEAPNLSQMMPDYFNFALCVCRLQYTIYGGEAIDMAYRADTQEALEGLVDDYGVQSQLFALIKPATESEPINEPSLRVKITQFARSSDAAAYVEDAPDWMQDFPESLQPFENVETAIDYGDVEAYESAVVLNYETTGGVTGAELEGMVMLVQDGRYVYEVSLDGYVGPELDALLDIVDQLEACSDGSCTREQHVTESLMDFFIAQFDVV
jgi:hypothetical protein